MELPQSNNLLPVCSYTHTELLSLRTKTSLLSLSTVDRLKDLNIGYHLPRRHRSSRGVKRKKQNLHSFIVACCCRPHSTNVLPAESSTRNHVAANSLSPQVARKRSTLSGFVQRSRLEREVGRDLHSNKWEEV